MEVEQDGITFDGSTVSGESITENADYEGVRIKFSGSLNSRMKDFYDIWLLSRQFDFHGGF